MPAVASITVKKADETTDITYDALVGAAGDTSAAVWRQDTGAVAAMPLGHRATLSMRTVWNGPRTARRAVVEYKRPYSSLNSATGRYEAPDACVARLEMTLPQAIPSSEIAEAVYQLMNLLGKSAGLIKQSVAAGYAPQ